jgi:hypothetical protein
LLVILAGPFFAPSAKAQTTSGKLKELCELNEVTGHDKSSAADNYRAGVCMGSLLSKLAEKSARQSRKHSIICPLASYAVGRLAIRKCCC